MNLGPPHGVFCDRLAFTAGATDGSARMFAVARLCDLVILPTDYAVCWLAPDAEVPGWATGGFVSVTRTADELSVVCPSHRVPLGVRAEAGWRMLQVGGPLDFAETGIVAGLTAPLAAAGVPVFVVSTYDTDYLLVPGPRLDDAAAALAGAGHRVAGAAA